MALTRTTEQGDYETSAHTIGALIERKWTKANTDQFVPKFMFDQDRANVINPTDMLECIVFTDGGTFPIPERTSLGHDLIGVGETIVMSVFASTHKRRKLFEFEIQLILRTYRPIAQSAFTPIKKSNDSDNSPIHDYDEIIPEFVTFESDEVQAKSSKSSAILTLLVEWQFT